jgi:hypothetical protein
VAGNCELSSELIGLPAVLHGSIPAVVVFIAIICPNLKCRRDILTVFLTFL